MPLRGRHHHRDRRVVREGEEYDDTAEEVELDTPDPRPEPPVDVQGEPWGWTKPGPRPRGFRDDGQYGPRHRDDPGPLDGRWPDESD
jgi:hypothetical protein